MNDSPKIYWAKNKLKKEYMVIEIETVVACGMGKGYRNWPEGTMGEEETFLYPQVSLGWSTNR